MFFFCFFLHISISNYLHPDAKCGGRGGDVIVLGQEKENDFCNCVTEYERVKTQSARLAFVATSLSEETPS